MPSFSLWIWLRTNNSKTFSTDLSLGGSGNAVLFVSQDVIVKESTEFMMRTVWVSASKEIESFGYFPANSINRRVNLLISSTAVFRSVSDLALRNSRLVSSYSLRRAWYSSVGVNDLPWVAGVAFSS